MSDTGDDIEARRAALKAERAAIQATREARAAKAADLSAIEEEERALANEKALDAAEADHGPVGTKIAAVYTDLGVVIVKRPHHNLYRKFQDKEKPRSIDLEQLVRPHVIYPDAAALDRILDELPGTLGRLGNAVYDLGTGQTKEVQGK